MSHATPRVVPATVARVVLHALALARSHDCSPAVPLVVPPTAEFVSEYSWGVPSSRVMPLYQQYRKPYPGAAYVPGERPLMPTPQHPSDTVQFGVHAIRGPWGSY